MQKIIKNNFIRVVALGLAGVIGLVSFGTGSNIANAAHSGSHTINHGGGLHGGLGLGRHGQLGNLFIYSALFGGRGGHGGGLHGVRNSGFGNLFIYSALFGGHGVQGGGLHGSRNNGFGNLFIYSALFGGRQGGRF